MNRQGKMQTFESNPNNETKADHPPVKATEKKKNEDVVTKEINPTLAFEKFANKVYDSNVVDFSDPGIAARTRKIASNRTEYISHTSRQRHFESPFNTANRLKQEIATFKEEMGTIASQERAAVHDVANAVLSEIDTLDKELNTVLNDKRVQAIIATPASALSLEAGGLAQSESAAVDKLVHQLENFSAGSLPTKSKAESKAEGKQGNQEVPTYELYYKAGDKSLVDGNIASLDKRVAQLEKTMGASNEEPAPSFPDMQTGLRNLARKMDLLDANKLEGIYRRIKGVMSELESLENLKAKQGQPNNQHEEKIDALYTLMSKWDSVCTSVPVLVARLQSLKEIHEDSATAMLRLDTLERQTDACQTILTEDKATLTKIGQNFATNIKTIQSNITTLEARVSSINAKVDQLAKAKAIQL